MLIVYHVVFLNTDLQTIQDDQSTQSPDYSYYPSKPRCEGKGIIGNDWQCLLENEDHKCYCNGTGIRGNPCEIKWSGLSWRDDCVNPEGEAYCKSGRKCSKLETISMNACN